MKKIGIVVILMLLISIVALTGCVAEGSKKSSRFDDNNILVVHSRGYNGQDDFLLITIFSTGNYTIYISFMAYSEIKTKTFYFSICSTPFQYKFVSSSIKSYELIVLKKT